MNKLTILVRSSFFITLVILGFSTTVYSQNNNDANLIIGQWIDQENTSTIQISQEGDLYLGKIVSLDEGHALLDANNPDETQRGNTVLDMTILTGFAYDSETNSWINGTIYDYKSGNSYDCKMWFEEDGSLSIRGFMGLSLIGRTSNWTKELAEK